MNLHRNQKIISKLSCALASSEDADTTVKHMQTGVAPDSVVDFCHSALKWLGTWITMPMCVRPPSGGLDICAEPSAPGLPLSAEYGECSASVPPRAPRWEYRRPYPATNAASVSASRVVAPPQWPLWFGGVTDRRLHWRLPPRCPKVLLRPQSPGSFLSHFSRDRWGWAQQRPPKPGFAQHAICGLPFPLHAFQLVTLSDQFGPEFLKQPHLTPVVEAAINRAVIPVDSGNMIPLAACAQSKDNPIQNLPPIHQRTTGCSRGIKLIQQRLDSVPQVVRNFPQGGDWAFTCCHRSLLG